MRSVTFARSDFLKLEARPCRRPTGRRSAVEAEALALRLFEARELGLDVERLSAIGSFLLADERQARSRSSVASSSGLRLIVHSAAFVASLDVLTAGRRSRPSVFFFELHDALRAARAAHRRPACGT